jgi:predicted molibdopterin-dependent oxidoreductase YjgC
MGALTGVLPGYKNIENAEDNKYFQDKWGTGIPQKKGLTLTEIISAAKDGAINFLYIMGENPMLSEPDTSAVKAALEKVNFLVVQDIFLTETAQLADLILPAASFAEKDGTFTNTERRIQRINKIIEPPAENILPDWEYIQEIADLLGHNWNYNSWEEIFAEITDCVPIYSHLKIADLNKKECFWPGDLLGESVKRLHQEQFTRGKAKLIYQPLPEPYQTTDEYPFLLIIGRLYEHYHTGGMTRKSKGINQLKPIPEIFINPKDAVRLKIKEKDTVLISGENGTIEAQAKLSLEVSQKQLFISFHFYEAVANTLTSKKQLDPQSKMAGIKIVCVNISRS